MANFAPVVDLMRSWGAEVRVTPGAYGRNNGIHDYNGGVPIGHINHHFVCGLRPEQNYIDGLVNMLINGYGDLAGAGSVVPWFQDMHGVSYLIADGPSNHSGKGSAAVLAARQRGETVLAPAGGDNSINGNAHYSGSEKQHPGDSTPWPDALIKATVLLNAAEAIIFADGDAGYAMMHYTHTNRKVDMSWRNGPNGDGQTELHKRVKALIEWHKDGGTGTPPLDAEGRMMSVVRPPSSPIIVKPNAPQAPEGLTMDSEVKAAFGSVNEALTTLARAVTAIKPAPVADTSAADLILFTHGGTGGIGVANLAAGTWRGLHNTAQVKLLNRVKRYNNMAKVPVAEVASLFGKQV